MALPTRAKLTAVGPPGVPNAGLFYALYVLIIGSIAAALFIAVDWLEPNRWYAFVLKLLIFSFGAAAIARQFLQ